MIPVFAIKSSVLSLVPIEIKSSKTYHSEFIEKLHYFQTLAKERAPKAFLIYAGETEQRIQNTYLNTPPNLSPHLKVELKK